MSNDEKTVGEIRRDMVVGVLAAAGVYPDRMSRSDIRRAVPRDKCDDGPLDNAIHVLKKRCVISRTADGYQLLTAPDWYNAKMLEERNAGGEKAPEAVKASPLDAKPLLNSTELPRKVKPAATSTPR